MKNGFQVETIMSRVSSLRDKGVSIGFHSKKELPFEQRALIMEYDGQEGWLVFKPNEVKDEEIPKVDADLAGKTPSQRLRAVLYVLHSQSGSTVKFEDYYREQMELFINSVKQKLE